MKTLDYVLTIIIPLGISVGSFFINASNTNKKNEKYRRKLDAREVSLNRVFEIYEKINIIYNYVYTDGLTNGSYVDDFMNEIRSSLEKNRIYLPFKIAKRFDVFLENLKNYSDILNRMNNKSNLKSDEEVNKRIKNKKKTMKKLIKSFKKLVKAIKKKYDMF